MSSTVFVVLLVAVVLVVYLGIAVRAYARMRGRRMVVCPETNKAAVVTVDAGHAARSAVWELPEIRLTSCTRWPEHADCNQACIGQIAVDPKGTSVDEILKAWYAGRACGVCRRAIPPVTGGDPRPGLLNVASRESLSWEEVPFDQLPAVLASHLPVCESCHAAAVFRRQFAELVSEHGRIESRDYAVH